MSAGEKKGSRQSNLPIDMFQAGDKDFMRTPNKHCRTYEPIPSARSSIYERLRSDRHDTAAAEELLATFLDLLTKLTLHRDALERDAESRAQNSD